MTNEQQELAHVIESHTPAEYLKFATGGDTMTQQELGEIMQAIEAEPVSLARTVALAMLAEVERLTARVAELECDLAETSEELVRWESDPEGMRVY